MKDAGQLTVDLPADLHAELYAEADRRGWNVSDVVRKVWELSRSSMLAVMSTPLPEPRHLCTFDVPIATPSLTNQREPWQARHSRVKAQRKAVWACAPALLRQLAYSEPFAIAIVDLTRHALRQLDSHDNLAAALKSCVDEVARTIGCDDRDPRVVWRYAQAKAKKPSVEISIAVRR